MEVIRPSSGAAHAAPLLRLAGIQKRFPGVHALDGVDLDLHPGEVHVLLGENGAGKSTLLRIIGGVLPRDAGAIYLDGQPIEIRSVHHARRLGIGMVHQELSLVPSLTVAENIALGMWPTLRWYLVDWLAIERQARWVLDNLGVKINPRLRINQLAVAEQQLVEIARVLSLRVRILLLDEPTSALPEQEREHLFAVLHAMRDRGVSIIYTSHRLGEIHRVGDRVTVLRDGRKMGTWLVAETDEDVLVRMMVGRELRELFPKLKVAIGPPLLEVSDLGGGALSDVSFTLCAGEILGVFGLRGAGRTTLARALFGLQPYERGTVKIGGRPVHIRRPQDAIRLGLGYLTEDRRQGLVPHLQVPPNMTLASLRHFVRYGLLDHQGERRTALHYVQELDIQPPILSRRLLFFSGGNQQKVALAKWLCSRTKVLILDEPTRGIDVAAKSEVFRLVGELARSGAGILLLSSELPEILAVSDRILVLRQGKVTGIFSRGEATQEALLKAATELSEGVT
ncbi:MAG: sugar ABC transporter ATP-binding protein [Armatimonadetes bacterium]|nr:sugar ABC transporter ATP-binding protein [Armatimonadota bacterium]MBI2972512.1 sugar ABC transporter ATP-binding protein [Armatimonadota bacterium]